MLKCRNVGERWSGSAGTLMAFSKLCMKDRKDGIGVKDVREILGQS